MGAKNGQLLISRKQIFLTGGSQIINTGLRQVNHSFGSSSENEPDLAARTMVIPLPKTVTAPNDWNEVRLDGEPFYGPDGSVLVALTWLPGEGEATFNVLFWAPHTLVGPVDAAPYVE